MSVKVIELADRPELVSELATWFAAVWEPYYGPQGPGDALADLRGACRKDCPPLSLIAVDRHGHSVGTATLRLAAPGEDPSDALWLAALVVPPSHAGRQVLPRLLDGAERTALRLGFDRIACAANTDATMANPGGWEELHADHLAARNWMITGAATSLRGPTAVYVRDLKR